MTSQTTYLSTCVFVSKIEQVRVTSERVRFLIQNINLCINSVPLCPFIARLVSGGTSSEGLVQIYYDNTWGWVCANQWGKHDADVACRMMDFDGASTADFVYTEKKKMGGSRVWLKSLSCVRNESSIFECVHEGLGSHDCEGERKAGVLCRSKGAKYD